MPGEETAITNNSANDLVFLYDGESLPGDLSDLNFTNPEFADNVQADDLFSFCLPGESVLSSFFP